MPRDYKHTRRRNHHHGLSGWAGLSVGLVIGLTVALAVYLYDRRPDGRAGAANAPMTAEDAPRDEARAPASQRTEPESQFEFYDMLEKFEVVIPESERPVRGNVPVPVTGSRPGTYVLQAGSFRNLADADRMRATLALQGIESGIQKVTVDNDTWHRVRIGPIRDPNRIAETQRQLRESRINALLIRVGD
jgi:cell division protein FtsN